MSSVVTTKLMKECKEYMNEVEESDYNCMSTWTLWNVDKRNGR